MDDELRAMWDACWDRLGAAERPQGLRWPVLATTGLGGAAEARIVVLRAADRAAARLVVHSDVAATKVSELRANPQATLVFWDAETSMQIRARVRARIVTGAEEPDLWDAVPDRERDAYGGEPPPGAPMTRPEDHESHPGAARFARIECEIRSLDILRLGRDGHRRAVFDAGRDFAGRWLAP